MRAQLQELRKLIWISVIAVFLTASSASAAIINLSAYVTIALLNEDGSAPLADGSIVQVIGSYDSIIDPMGSSGGGYLGTTTGDDLIIATITIDSSQLGSNGTFYVGNLYYESDDVNYMYLRFFDSTGPLTGLISWGESPVTNVEYDAFGSIVVEFSGGYGTTNTDTFTIIPEPNTLSLVMVWSGMLAALKSTMRRREQEKKKGPQHTQQQPRPPYPANTYDRF